jgi:Ca-activated chloride channel family protein
MRKEDDRNKQQYNSALLGVVISEVLFWGALISVLWVKSEFAPHVELHKPELIPLLAILPIATFAFLLHLRWKTKAIGLLSDSNLQDATLPGFSPGREAWRFVVWRLALSMVIFGLLGPKVGSRLQEVETKGADFVIAIDVSNSMRAEDLGVERIALARQTVERILNKLGSDRVGLVVFAGEAYIQCPLTSDYSAIKLFLNSVTTDVVATQGTALGSAIDVSVKAFDNAPESSRSILLITDGENHEDDPVAAASSAFEQGITVHVLGVATPEGAPIPHYDKRGRKIGFIHGPDGQPVVSRLDESVLVATVQAGGGSFTRANRSYIDISPVIDALNKEEKTRIANVRFTDYDHRFQFFLLLALGLIIMEAFIPNPTKRR